MECSQTTWAAAASSRRRRAAQHKKAVQHKCSDALLLHCKAMCVTVTAIDTENHQWKNNYARTHTYNHAHHMHSHICTSVECKERVQKIGAHTKCKMGKKEAENNKNKAKTKAIVNYKCPKSGWGCCCCCRQRLRIVFEVEQQPRQHSLGSTSSSADKDDGFEILLDAARSFCCCCGCCFLLKLHMHRCWVQSAVSLQLFLLLLEWNVSPLTIVMQSLWHFVFFFFYSLNRKQDTAQKFNAARDVKRANRNDTYQHRLHLSTWTLDCNRIIVSINLIKM